jgi:hypothetical protein
MTTLAIVGAAYLVFLLLILAVLTVAKRADESMERHVRALRGAVEAFPDHAALGRVAAEICDVLQAERVSVVLTDPAEPSTGVVRACLGAPGVLGSRVPVEPRSATGVLGATEASVLGLAPEAGSPAWQFAHVPIAEMGDVVGAVTAASRSRTFAEADLTLIEHVARGGARPFDRRRIARTGGGQSATTRLRRPA